MTSKPVDIKVNPSTVIGTTYSQLVSVTVTDTEVTLEFIYVNPRTKDEGQVVSRVTLPLQTAKSLDLAISETIKNHEQKKTKVM